MSKNQYDVECSILKLRIYEPDFSGCELFVSVDNQKKCFYGKIQSTAKTIEFNRSKHLIASVDFSQQSTVNLFFSAKKPHAEFTASRNIYNVLIKADSIESNIMESMSVLMKSKSNRNVAEIFFTLIVNLSYFSPIRNFSYRVNDSRAKPSIFTPDTRFNPSKALSQELSKLSSSKRVKLNYQLSPKQDHKLFDTLSNQLFNETSSSDFDNGSFVASSQAEVITEPPNQSSHSSVRKHHSSAFSDTNSFVYSSSTERSKDNKSTKEEEEKVDTNQVQNQSQQFFSNSSSNIDKFQAERINTPESINSQSKLPDVGKHSVRKPVSWRKGKKPEFLKSDKENETDTKLPSLDELQSNDSHNNNNKNDIIQQMQADKNGQNENVNNNSNTVKIPEISKPNDKTKNFSPILDILNSAPHLSPRLPHLEPPKLSMSVQQQKIDNNPSNSISQNSEIPENKNSQNEDDNNTNNDEIITIQSEDSDDNKNKDSETKEDKETSNNNDDSVRIFSDEFEKSDTIVSEPEKSDKPSNSKSGKSESESIDMDFVSDKKSDSSDKNDERSDRKDESDDSKDEKEESSDKKDENNDKEDEDSDKKDKSSDKKEENENKKDESSETEDDDDFF